MASVRGEQSRQRSISLSQLNAPQWRGRRIIYIRGYPREERRKPRGETRTRSLSFGEWRRMAKRRRLLCEKGRRFGKLQRWFATGWSIVINLVVREFKVFNKFFFINIFQIYWYILYTIILILLEYINIFILYYIYYAFILILFKNKDISIS